MEIDVEHKKVIVPALFAYLSETDSYLRGFRPDAEPTELDTCCEAHLFRWKTAREMNENLLQRRDAIAAALEAIGEIPWDRER